MSRLSLDLVSSSGSVFFCVFFGFVLLWSKSIGFCGLSIVSRKYFYAAVGGVINTLVSGGFRLFFQLFDSR